MESRLHRIFVAQFDRRTVLRAAGAAGLASLVASQGTVFAQDSTPSAGAADSPELVITATDYAFDLPATVAGGWTKVTMDNQSPEDHHAMLMRPAEGTTMDDLTAALQSPDLGALFSVATSVGGPNNGGGQTSSVILDLEPGQYMVVCVIPGEDGTPHYMMGMQAPLEVTEVEGDATAPAADTELTLVEMSFEGLPADVAAGEHIWEVTNGGEQPHELIIQKLSDGVTFEMAKGLLMASPDATPAAAQATAMATMQGPPFVGVGGVAPMMPGHTNYAVLDLKAGDYFAICFVPDAQTGMPHFMMGMISPFTVS